MMTGLSMYPIVETWQLNMWVDADYMANFVQNGAFWKVLAFSTAVGGCLLCFTNPSDLALMKMERMRVGWYLKNCTGSVFVGWLLGLAVLWLEYYLIY